MKKITLLVGIFINPINFYGQNAPQKYYNLIKKADSLHSVKDYKKAAFVYSSAFKEAGWKGFPIDRYNAACSWAMANYPDSAFFNLSRIITLSNYVDYGHIISDIDLNSLHKDKRWQSLTEKVKENKDKAEEHLNKPLVYQLDTIYIEDQKYRMQMEEVEEKHSMSSIERTNLIQTIVIKDAINLIKITAILDKYGWLGPDVIGVQGSSTLFLVIQHSNQETQEKYLPMMREAVKKKQANIGHLALLEDRVALGQGKKQIYGSQIGGIPGKYYVLPLEDPDNVDKRRTEVGLPPLAEYISRWQIKWDVEEYKRNNQ